MLRKLRMLAFMEDFEMANPRHLEPEDHLGNPQ
jgi:hypothetical protein